MESGKWWIRRATALEQKQLGIFDDVAQAIQFDEEGITRVVANISELKAKLPEALRRKEAHAEQHDAGLRTHGELAGEVCGSPSGSTSASNA